MLLIVLFLLFCVTLCCAVTLVLFCVAFVVCCCLVVMFCRSFLCCSIKILALYCVVVLVFVTFVVVFNGAVVDSALVYQSYCCLILICPFLALLQYPPSPSFQPCPSLIPAQLALIFSRPTLPPPPPGSRRRLVNGIARSRRRRAAPVGPARHLVVATRRPIRPRLILPICQVRLRLPAGARHHLPRHAEGRPQEHEC